MSHVGENFILIGSVKGFGYNCMAGMKVSEFGEYNRISHWVDWIRVQMHQLGEKVCGF